MTPSSQIKAGSRSWLYKTVHQSVKVLFEQNATFEVPKYQRGYAWDDDAIEDFIEDIEKCLKHDSMEARSITFLVGLLLRGRRFSF